MGCLSFLPCKWALQNNITFPSPNDYQQPALQLCFKPLQDRQTFRSEIFSLTLQPRWGFCSENKQGRAKKNAK